MAKLAKMKAGREAKKAERKAQREADEARDAADLAAGKRMYPPWPEVAFSNLSADEEKELGTMVRSLGGEVVAEVSNYVFLVTPFLSPTQDYPEHPLDLGKRLALPEWVRASARLGRWLNSCEFTPPVA